MMMKLPLAGGTATSIATLSSQAAAIPVAMDGANLAWADGTLRAMPVAGGAVTMLATPVIRFGELRQVRDGLPE